jgi:hypothetical protein
MAIRDRIMSLNMRQPFREDVARPMPMPTPMPMPILPPAPRQPLPLPMLPPIMPPRREDFLSIERLDDPIMKQLPVGPSIPFVPPPQPPVLPIDIPAPVLPQVFNQPLAPAPISIMEQPLSGADLELARSSGRGGLKGVFDNIQEFIAKNPDKTRQGGGFLGGVDLTGESLRRAYDEGRGVLQRPTIPPRRDDFMSIERIAEPRDEFIPPVAPPPVVTPEPVISEPVVTPEPKIQPTPTTEPTPGDTMQPINVSNQDPFAASVTQQQVGLDPLTEQLLFGIGGQGGFIPGAMRAAEKVFYDDQGNPVVIDEQVAGFSPDQLQAMQMQRDALGIQNPFLQGAGQAFGAGTQALEEGLQRGRTAAIGALDATRGGVGSLQSGLGESADILRSTLGGYDPSMTSQFYDPFEDRVVQQTIEDIMEQGAKSDIGARASDIARGGESAFGSRARLGASERQEALGRGLAEALGGIRSRGFQQAQQTGLGEFARQKAAERAASSGLASLAGQGFGGSQALAGALSGLGQTEQDIGQQRYSGQFGLGTGLQGLGAQAAGASASDIAALYGMGAQQQGQTQQMLDAQRRNLQQRQMTPLLQYQALAPFVSMAPAGQFQTTTQFAPRPSAMQTGIGTGLAAFGALGNLYGGN